MSAHETSSVIEESSQALIVSLGQPNALHNDFKYVRETDTTSGH